MVLWTIQPLTIWHAFRDCGELSVRQEFVDKDHLLAYEWMVRQMEQRLSRRPQPDRMPVWAWYQYYGQSQQRPDLRCGAHLPRGTPGARIEFETEPAEVLLSDFDLWHCVLNCWYLPRSIADEKRFERDLKQRDNKLGGAPACRRRELLETDVEFQRRLSASWERIFEIYWFHRHYTAPFAKKSIQACLWAVKLNQVRHVSFFRAR